MTDDISTDRAYVRDLMEKESVMYALSAGMFAQLLKKERTNGILIGIIITMAVIGYAVIDRTWAMLDTYEIRISRLESQL